MMPQTAMLRDELKPFLSPEINLNKYFANRLQKKKNVLNTVLLQKVIKHTKQHILFMNINSN